MYKHVSYLENIAKRLKAISHSPVSKAFYSSDSITNLVQLFSSATTAKYPALVALDDPSSNDTPEIDAPATRRFYSFVVICKPASASTTDAAKAKEEAEVIARKIVAKMRHDSLEGEEGFRPGSLEADVSFSSTGRLLNTLQGCMVSFTVNETLSYRLNPEDWL
jgi:hypothetical protein